MNIALELFFVDGCRWWWWWSLILINRWNRWCVAIETEQNENENGTRAELMIHGSYWICWFLSRKDKWKKHSGADQWRSSISRRTFEGCVWMMGNAYINDLKEASSSSSSSRWRKFLRLSVSLFLSSSVDQISSRRVTQILSMLQQLMIKSFRCTSRRRSTSSISPRRRRSFDRIGTLQ